MTTHSEIQAPHSSSTPPQILLMVSFIAEKTEVKKPAPGHIVSGKAWLSAQAIWLKAPLKHLAHS
jgi:hypothetical protein